VSREARRLLDTALDEGIGDPAWRDLVAQALALIGAFRSVNEWT
jgi:hypothetical protein